MKAAPLPRRRCDGRETRWSFFGACAADAPASSTCAPGVRGARLGALPSASRRRGRRPRSDPDLAQVATQVSPRRNPYCCTPRSFVTNCSRKSAVALPTLAHRVPRSSAASRASSLRSSPSATLDTACGPRSTAATARKDGGPSGRRRARRAGEEPDVDGVDVTELRSGGFEVVEVGDGGGSGLSAGDARSSAREALRNVTYCVRVREAALPPPAGALRAHHLAPCLRYQSL